MKPLWISSHLFRGYFFCPTVGFLRVSCWWFAFSWDSSKRRVHQVSWKDGWTWIAPLVREIEVETCMLKLVDTLKYICVYIYIYICILYIRKAFYMCIHIYIYLNGSSQNHDRELSPFLPESFSDFRLKTKTKWLTLSLTWTLMTRWGMVEWMLGSSWTVSICGSRSINIHIFWRREMLITMLSKTAICSPSALSEEKKLEFVRLPHSERFIL